MSTKYKASNPDKAYFITITTIGWVDLFTRLNHKNLIINSLKYCQEQRGLEIFSYVLMPSHLHMLCRANNGFELLSQPAKFDFSLKKDFKVFSEKFGGFQNGY